MRIPTCRLHTGMAEGRLHQADRRATVEGMARMRVAQPVGRDPRRQVCPLCGDLHDADDLCGQEWPARLHTVHAGELVRTLGHAGSG